MLKVGMLTSYNTICGISEYSRYLVSAMLKTERVDLTVLGSRNYAERKVEEDESYVLPAFDVQPWNPYGNHKIDVDKILELDLDVLHIQYEVIFYNQDLFRDLLEEFQGLKVLTFHDNCIPPTFPLEHLDLLYTHREDFGIGVRYLLPMGVEFRIPVVKTFGLGRSREDLISDICFANGWAFESSFGERDWKQAEELYQWLRDSDAIVLYYEDVPAAGTSIAARVAISTRRPVFVNDVTWFRDLSDKIDNLTKVKDVSSLEIELRKTLNNAFIEINDWELLANELIDDYYDNIESKTQHSDLHTR